MDVLAKEAGVARATVYEHFRSKRAVLDELRRRPRARSSRSNDQARPIGDPLAALRDMLGEVCRHWSDNETTVRELRTLAAMTGGDAAGDGIDPGSLRKLVEALAERGQLRTHWSLDDAVDALAVLTSYATYERLRRPARARPRRSRRCSPSSPIVHHLAGHGRDTRLHARPDAARLSARHVPRSGADDGLVDDPRRRLDEIGPADADRFELPVERGHPFDQRDERRAGGRGATAPATTAADGLRARDLGRRTCA